jgi:hypothetical protein
MNNLALSDKSRPHKAQLIAGTTVLMLFTSSCELMSVLFIGCWDGKEVFRTTDGRRLALRRHPHGYIQPDGTLLTISIDPSINWSEVEVKVDHSNQWDRSSP